MSEYYDDDEYYGGAKANPKRKLSEWNRYVQKNYPSVKHMPFGEAIRALAAQARKDGIIKGNPVKRSQCYGKVPQGTCESDRECAWRAKTAKRREHCTKGIRKGAKGLFQ